MKHCAVPTQLTLKAISKIAWQQEAFWFRKCAHSNASIGTAYPVPWNQTLEVHQGSILIML